VLSPTILKTSAAAIIVVPERSIGSSFAGRRLTGPDMGPLFGDASEPDASKPEPSMCCAACPAIHSSLSIAS
jgi:hypothetical protein